MTVTPSRIWASTLSPSVSATWRMLSPKRATRRWWASRHAAGRARPGADPVGDVRVLPVADDGLAGDPQPGLDEPELAVAVGGLVQVHEVHVDLGPRQIAVELRVQVEQRLGQRLEAGDPHPGRRERVHPGDDADARVARRSPRGSVAAIASAERDDRLGRRPGPGSPAAASRAAATLAAFAATWRSASSPYRSWLPVTNQTSRSARGDVHVWLRCRSDLTSPRQVDEVVGEQPLPSLFSTLSSMYRPVTSAGHGDLGRPLGRAAGRR